MSNVTLIHKKGETTDKSNYRPVSVLSAISKLFEKVMFDQLYSSFTTTFSSNMLGFPKRHSCAAALIKLETRSRRKERSGCGCHQFIKGFRPFLPQFTPRKIKGIWRTRGSPSAYKIIFAWRKTKGNMQRFKLYLITSTL